MLSAIPPKPRQAVVEILDFMRTRNLALDDLINSGGGDLSAANPKRIEKAHRVEKCWSLMARLSVKFADLESALPPTPDKRPRRRRGEGHFSEVIENTGVSDTSTTSVKSNEINDLANSAPVGDPDRNPGPLFGGTTS